VAVLVPGEEGVTVIVTEQFEPTGISLVPQLSWVIEKSDALVPLITGTVQFKAEMGPGLLSTML
jgi:hypothetical protein